ncbi:MAG: FHA domain-containing protein [Gemmataceae bacterium]
MSDPQFQSIHLENQQTRREQFRIARRALEEQCGNQTLAGDLGLLSAGDPGDGPTIDGPIGLAHAYWLTDGTHTHQLSIGVNSVGRLPDNQVVIRDEHISRRHFAIVIHSDGRCEIHDIASKNGTVLNGKKINGPTKIKPDDEITICTRRMTFIAGDPPPSKPKSKASPSA